VIQLVEFTNSGEPQFGSLGSIEMLTEEMAFWYFSDLEEKILLDYQKKNTEAYPIKNYLPDSAPVLLVNPTDGNQLGWWVSYSRIGFNSSLTQALVLVGDCRGTSCYYSANVSMYSTGVYWLLEKKDEKWTIKDGQMDWRYESEPH